MKDAWDTWDSVRQKKLHAALAAEGAFSDKGPLNAS